MATATLHTPLEILLFFQSLRSIGVDLSAFTKIAESLKANELIRESETFDADRLSPDALKGLYLSLIKDEIRNEIAKSESSAGVVDGQHNPRKRKLSTPPIETISEASKHIQLLPQLWSRLYARYKENAVKAIEDEERRYRMLTRDIQEIEPGEWDARLQHEETFSKKDSKSAASIQTILRHDSGVVPTLQDGPRQADSPGLQNASPSTVPLYRTLPLPDAKPLDTSTNLGTNAYQTQSSSTAGGQQGQVAPHDIPQDIPRPSSQPRSRDNVVPYLPPPQVPNQLFSMGSPLTEGHRRLPQAAPQLQSALGPSPSSRANQVPLTQPERSSASPIILPPPPGMLRSSGSPAGPLDALADMAGQQYRTNPPLPSPRPSQHSGPQQHPVQLPQPRNYMRNAYPYYDSQSPYASSYQQYGQPPLPQYYPPTHSGMPPFPSPGSVHGQGARPGHPPQYQSPLPPYGHYHGYNPNPYSQTPQAAPFNPSHVARFVEQRTPVPTSSARRRLPQPSPINTSVSSTKWKNTDHPTHVRSPGSPVSPASGDVSPVSEKAPSPILEPSQKPERMSPSQKGDQKPKKDTSDIGHDNGVSSRTPSRPARGGRSRGTTSRGRGGRAWSTTSSAVAGSATGRTRSQSLVSHADELSMDATQGSSRKIKPETPASIAGDDNIDTADNTPDEQTRKPRRPRRGTLRGVEVPELNGTSSKPRRSVQQDAPDGTETPDVRPPTSPSIASSKLNHIQSSRNFPRTSATIMNDITAHKLASLFAKPLTEREAPGYKNLIYRPQDLKSIKSAISAGSRAVAAALETIGTPANEAGSPTEGVHTPSKSTGPSLWVSMNADVVPPKGIVNSAQLEKELMRMFANAVMFNPDPKRGFGSAFRNRHTNDDAEDEEMELGAEEEGGIVADAREMFEAVEKSVTNWRAAERAVENTTGSKGSVNKLRATDDKEEDEVDELAGEEDTDKEKGTEEGPSVLGKRRRK